jgi:hypothetical protein
VKKIYQQRQLEDDFKSQIQAEKALEFLIDKANITDTALKTEIAEKEN